MKGVDRYETFPKTVFKFERPEMGIHTLQSAVDTVGGCLFDLCMGVEYRYRKTRKTLKRKSPD